MSNLDARLQARLGALPAEPPTGFIGRSRELLALERLLRPARRGLLRKRRWALIRGQGGEGKTALACELGRWLVRSGQIERAAFCSVESHGLPAAVLDTLGRQLVGKDYSAAAFASLALARQPIERVLKERPTLLVIDNLESILPPPFLAAATPAALTEEWQATAAEILDLCSHLLTAGEMRARLGPEESAALGARWMQAMGQYVQYLDKERNRRTEIAAALKVLDLPNLLALLDRVQEAGEAAATIRLATSPTGPFVSVCARPRPRVGGIPPAGG